MARPRVFVSSPFYDLRVVRADIELALSQLCFDAIMSERGRIPYEKDKRLEQSCYREIGNCDIVVAIIGGRTGSTSAIDAQFTVSQLELKTAVDLDKQVFAFVDRNVFVEYGTWLKNRDSNIKWNHTEDVRIFEFLKVVNELPKNNALQVFETATDITAFLKEQFAGLFQRLLSEHEVRQELSLSNELRATAQLLNAAVEKATNPASGKLPELIFANQPLFKQLQHVLSIPYRVFFTNLNELNAWLKARQFVPVDQQHWDSLDAMEWTRSHTDDKDIDLLTISNHVFDDQGNVEYIPQSQWNADMVTLVRNYNSLIGIDPDDEIPF